MEIAHIFLKYCCTLLVDLLASFFNNKYWIQRYKLNFDPNVTWLYRGPTALNKMHRENFLCANLDHRQASGGLAVRTLHTSLIHATISRCSADKQSAELPRPCSSVTHIMAHSCAAKLHRDAKTLLLNSFTRAGAVIRLGTCLVVCKYEGKERPPARVYSRLNVSTNETIVEKKKLRWGILLQVYCYDSLKACPYLLKHIQWWM